MPDLITNVRNATLEDMVGILRTQQAAKLDIVTPAAELNFADGNIVIAGKELELTEDGFMDLNGTYRPTAVFDEGVADRLDIPIKYLRKMRGERTDLYDTTLNGWLKGRKAKTRFENGEHVEVRSAIAADNRNFLLRLFKGEDGAGVARALLSDRYATMDNLDGLMAMLAGLRDAGIENVEFDRCDITDRRMYVRVTAPEIRTMAPELLKGYRNPFAHNEIQRWRGVAEQEGLHYTEEEGGEPIVFAGFTFSNSEVGNGRWQISPQVVVKVCKNGLTITEDIFGKTHLGAKLEEGQIKWSAETQALNVQMVTSQTKDVVTQFMTKEYVQASVEKLEEKAGIPLRKPADAMKVIAKKMGFADQHVSGLLEHFILGGQHTAGGVLNAITSYSQTLPDADLAFEMDRKAVPAMAFAASL